MTTKEPPVIVVQLFENSIETVWKAISELEQMHQWYFDTIPKFKAKVGFKKMFNVEAPSRDFMHMWEVTEVIPQEKLVYKWQFEGLLGESYSIFKLVAVDSKTKLTLTNKITQDFDTTIPEFKRESCQEGWEYFIKKSLLDYLS